MLSITPIVLPSPSMPPAANITQFTNDFIMPEILKLAGFICAVLVVFAVFKAFRAK